MCSFSVVDEPFPDKHLGAWLSMNVASEYEAAKD